MSTRLLLAALTLGLALPAVTALPAAAEDPAKQFQFQRRLGGACPPSLKFAAGACVRRCPAGYADEGRTCRLRQQSSGSGRN